MNSAEAHRLFQSIDKTTSTSANYIKPDRYRIFESLPKNKALIARGAGLSYVAASFSEHSLSIDMRHFDRILDFSPAQKTITVEAGISLEKLQSFLSPQNLTVPVLPGHPSITVGGCIAGDIYGKNHVHQGLFHNFVKELTLYHPNHGFIIASKDKNEKLFNLSCGGFGLTGIITQTTLLLAELPQQNVEVRNIEVNDLFETFDKLKEFSANHAGVYSWNDLLSSFGKGFIVCSKFTEKEATPKPKQSLLQGPARNYPLLNLALTPPVPAIANYCYRKSNLQRNHQVISFYDFSFPIVTKSWYYSLYGRTGFIEKQILVPKTSANDYLKAFKVLLSKYRPFIGLTSCKIFNGEKTLLRFDGEGVVLTLDVSARTKDKAFLNELDKLNGKFNAFTNLLKDSHIDTLTAKAQHPEYEEFKTSLMEFDPNRIFVSELSRRLAL